MSREVMQAGYEAWNRGDIDALIALCHPDIEWRPHLARVAGGAIRGHDEIRAMHAEIAESWERFELEIEEVFTAGDDELVVFVRVVGRGRGSGADTEISPAHHIVFRDGLHYRMTTYLDRGNALEAAGIASAHALP